MLPVRHIWYDKIIKCTGSGMTMCYMGAKGTLEWSK